MIKWIYDIIFLEHRELLFIISNIIILLMIIITIFLIKNEVKRSNGNN